LLNIALLFGKQTVSVSCGNLQAQTANYAYLVRFRGHRKLIALRGKFAAVCRGIWQTGAQNLEQFAAENCGLYYWCWCCCNWCIHLFM